MHFVVDTCLYSSRLLIPIPFFKDQLQDLSGAQRNFLAVARRRDRVGPPWELDALLLRHADTVPSVPQVAERRHTAIADQFGTTVAELTQTPPVTVLTPLGPVRSDLPPVLGEEGARRDRPL